MKVQFRTYIMATFVIACTLFASCGSDDTPPEETPQQIATGILTSSGWSLANGGSIVRDNQDVSGQYIGLTVSFTFSENAANTYSTTNSGGSNGQNRLFLASGTWDWANTTTNNLIDIMDSDKGDITITTLDENTFSFRFNQLNNAGIAAGTAGLSGAYQITLTK